jgi:O-acetyl-ADP-ribose deacetylase (regulator of RNase III)
VSEPWTWAIGEVTLEVRVGDLLAAPEPVWVNSEQSGFRMARGTRTVSGQLVARWPAMQAELLALTRGEVLPPGTVLETSGPGGRRVLHAGFHAPDDWLVPGEDDAVALHASTIQRCVELVLGAVRAAGRPAVAFPMIGTGAFGLPVEVFARLFFTAVAQHARATRAPLRVALRVWHEDDLEPVVRAGTRALSALLGGEPLLDEAGGHALVQAARRLVTRSADELLTELHLLRFAETALATDFAVLSELHRVAIEEVLEAAEPRRGFLVSFGLVRNRLEGLAHRKGRSLPRWAQRRASTLASPEAKAAIGRLVEDRNALAHKRRPRAIADILVDVDALLGPRALDEPWPELDDGPWLRRFETAAAPAHALLDAVDPVRREKAWLLPLTRERRFASFP